jgi:hypothetical protein
MIEKCKIWGWINIPFVCVLIALLDNISILRAQKEINNHPNLAVKVSKCGITGTDDNGDDSWINLAEKISTLSNHLGINLLQVPRQLDSIHRILHRPSASTTFIFSCLFSSTGRLVFRRNQPEIRGPALLTKATGLLRAMPLA